MMRSLLCLFCALPLLACSALAGTFYVGTCHANSFATLADAVASPQVAPGSIVNICPGGYAGQVVVSKPLTIKGISAKNAQGYTTSGANFQAGETFGTPTNSLVLGTSLYPMIWITASPVNLSNVYLDMDQAGDAPTKGSCPQLRPAIFYASGSSGTLNHVVIRASQGDTWEYGCGVGLWAEDAGDSETVTVENSSIQSSNYGVVAASLQANGFAPALNINITGTQISQFKTGLYLFQTRGTVSGNNIVDGANASFVAIKQEAPATIVTKNTINVLQGDAVYILEDFVTLTDNKISAEGNDVDLGCHTATVTGNSLDFGTYGLNHVPASFTGKNTFFNLTFAAIVGC